MGLRFKKPRRELKHIHPEQLQNIQGLFLKEKLICQLLGELHGVEVLESSGQRSGQAALEWLTQRLSVLPVRK